MDLKRENKYKNIIVHLSWIIGLLILVSIFIATFRLSDNASVIDFVGFASNLISLVLGLVAIFYSFVTSSQSSQSLGALTSASEQINEGAEKISDISTSVSSSLDSLSKVSTSLDVKLEQLLGHSLEVSKKVSELDKSFRDQFISNQSKTASKSDSKIDVDEEAVKSFFASLSPSGTYVTYAAYMSFKAGKVLSLKKLKEAIYPAKLIENRVDVNYYWAVLVTLEALSFIESDMDVKEDDVQIKVKEINNVFRKVLNNEEYIKSIDSTEKWVSKLSAIKALFEQ